MNRFIAKIFSGFLALIHIGYILFLIGAIVAFYSKDNPIRDLFLQLGIPQGSFLIFIFATFIGYVLVMGLLSTFVAINDNLERLYETIKRN